MKYSLTIGQARMTALKNLLETGGTPVMKLLTSGDVVLAQVSLSLVSTGFYSGRNIIGLGYPVILTLGTAGTEFEVTNSGIIDKIGIYDGNGVLQVTMSAYSDSHPPIGNKEFTASEVLCSRTHVSAGDFLKMQNIPALCESVEFN